MVSLAFSISAELGKTGTFSNRFVLIEGNKICEKRLFNPVDEKGVGVADGCHGCGRRCGCGRRFG